MMNIGFLSYIEGFLGRKTGVQKQEKPVKKGKKGEKTMLFSEEIIRSRQNRTVVELCKLTDRSNRESAGLFRFDGVKLTADAIRAGLEIPLLFLREGNAGEMIQEIAKRTGRDPETAVGRILCLEDALFAKISEEKSPEGVICVAKYIDKLQKNAAHCNFLYKIFAYIKNFM